MSRRSFLTYAVAVISTIAALLLSLWLDQVMAESHGAFFYLAIAISTWYGGLRPGIVTLVLSALAMLYFLASRSDQTQLFDYGNLAHFFLFTIVSLLITLLSAKLKENQQKIERLNHKLLQESTDRLKLALNAAQMGMWNWNIVTGEVQWSQEKERLLGFTAGQFDGRYETFLHCLHPDDRERVQQSITQALVSRLPYQCEYRMQGPDGRSYWVEGRGQTFYNETGDPVQMLGTVMLIDQRKQIEAALRQSETRLRLAQAASHSGVWDWDIQTNTVFWSPEYYQLYQLDPSVAASYDNWLHHVHPDDQARVHQQTQQALATRASEIRIEFRVIRSGTLYWFADIGQVLYDESDTPIRMIGIAIDITQQKQIELALQKLNAELEHRVTERTAELVALNERLSIAYQEQVQIQRALRESEERRRLALDLTQIGFWDYDLIHRKLIWNDNHFMLLGFTPGSYEASYELWASCVHPDDLPRINQQLSNSLSNQTQYRTEYRVIHPDGEIRWVMARAQAIYDEAGQPVRSLGICLDVTDRKQAEIALTQAELRLRTLFDTSIDGIVVLDQAGNVIEANTSFAQMLGYSLEEITSLNLTDFDAHWSHEDLNHKIDEQQLCMNTFETRYRRQDGSIYDVEISSNSLAWEGQMVQFCICRDISDRKATQRALQQQAERERTLHNVVQSIRGSLELDTIFTLSAKQIAELMQGEVSLVQYLPDHSCWRNIMTYSQGNRYPEKIGADIPDAGNPFAQRLKQFQIVRIDDTTLIDDPINQELAQRFPGAWLLIPINVNGTIWGSLTLARPYQTVPWQVEDIDLAQRVADQLAIAIHQASLFQQIQQLNQELEHRVQERTTQLQLALSAANMGIWEADLATNQQHWSPENYALLGFLTDEQGRVLDQNGTEISPAPTFELFQRCVHPDDFANLMQHEQTMFDWVSSGEESATKPWEWEYRVVWLDGTIHWRFTRSSFILDEHNQPTKLVGISMDITERKQAELALRESQERFSKVFHASPIGIAITTFPEGRLLDINESYLQLLGYQQPEVIGKTTLELSVWESNEARNYLLETLAQGKSVRNLEVQFRNSAGIVGTGILAVEQMELGGQPCLLKMLYDISDRKAAEEQIRASLKEKEVLLKEIHHRVKNNLQIITSLLRMQSQQIDKHQIIDLLKAAQNRIHSMALIHEQLYQAPDLAGIDFSHYLQTLITNLFRSYREDSHQVIPILEAESITLSIDTAIPCGLIVNELVTNALKYAFPNQQPGEICIRLHSASDPTDRRSLISLTISDNGIGIPPSLDLENTESLGLAIVPGLVRQIHGSISLDRNQGTHFHITFPKP